MKLSENTDFENTLRQLGKIECEYVVMADGCEMYRSEDFSKALVEFRRWVAQLNAALPSMGDKCSIEVLL